MGGVWGTRPGGRAVHRPALPARLPPRIRRLARVLYLRCSLRLAELRTRPGRACPPRNLMDILN